MIHWIRDFEDPANKVIQGSDSLTYHLKGAPSSLQSSFSLFLSKPPFLLNTKQNLTKIMRSQPFSFLSSKPWWSLWAPGVADLAEPPLWGAAIFDRYGKEMRVLMQGEDSCRRACLTRRRPQGSNSRLLFLLPLLLSQSLPLTDQEEASWQRHPMVQFIEVSLPGQKAKKRFR